MLTSEVCTQYAISTYNRCALLDFMQKFHDIATANGLPYWITFGTLLGQVRHRTIIPWDDDLDIAVRERDEALLNTVLRKFCMKYPMYRVSPYQFKPACRGYKLYAYLDTTIVGLDVFLMKDIIYEGEAAYDSGWGDDIYKHAEVFDCTGKICEAPFGKGTLCVPHTPEPYLHRQYMNWDTVAYIFNREHPDASASYAITPSVLAAINTWVHARDSI